MRLAAQPFVGRRGELTALGEALEHAAAEHPRLVLVGGEPGIGKTRLCEVFSERARESGAEVIWSRCWDWGGAPSYWPFLQIVRVVAASIEDDEELRVRAGRGRDLLGALLPELAERLGRLADLDSDPRRARFALFEAVTGFLRRSAEGSPLVLVFDDLHGADVPSLELLRFMFRDATPARLLAIATYRTVDAAIDQDARAVLVELGREAQNLHLGGLQASAIAELVGGTSDDATRLHAATGGNPLFVDGVLRARSQQARSEEDGSFPLSPDVRSAISARIARLPEAARRVLAAAAVIARPCTLALIGRALDLPLVELVTPAGQAVQGGLLVESAQLGQYAFFHPLVREVTYGALEPGERLSLHLSVARALERLYGRDPGPHLPELARHFFLAAPLGTGPEAVRTSLAAGQHALAVFAFEEAAHHFEQAREALAYAGGESTLTILEGLAEARLASGSTERARHLFDELAGAARSSGDATALGRAAIGFARTFEFAILEPRRLALLEEAEARLGEGDSPTRAKVLARLAMELWMVPGAAERRAALAERAVEMAHRLADAELAAYTLNAWLQCVWGPEELSRRTERAGELARIADRSGNLERMIEAQRWRINVLVEVGDIAQAELAIADYARLAAALRRPQYVANAVMRETMLPQLRGELDHALEDARRTRDAMAEAGDPQAEVVFDSRRILLSIELGLSDELARLLPQMRAHVEARPGLPLYRAIYLQGLVASGEIGAARGEWERLWLDDQRDLNRDMMMIATLALLVPPCMALGDVARARRLHALLEPFQRFHAAIGASYSLGSAARYVGLCAELAGDTDEAARALESALVMNERMGARRFAVQTARELARVLERRGRGGDRERAASLRAPAEPVPPPAVDDHLERCSTTREPSGSSARARGADGVKASRGLRYLRTLLERTGVDVHVLELVGTEASAVRHRAASGDAGPLLDAQAKAEYRARIDDLRDTIAEAEAFADEARAAKARAELEMLSRELARAVGLGGRDRPTASAAERARISVAKALGRAISAIAEVDPELARHLDASIRTGAFCRYDPEPRARITWSF